MIRCTPLCACLLLLASTAWAVPMQLAHQGRLLGSDGSPLEGEHTLTFALFDAESGGAEVWSEAVEASLVGGFYSAILGAEEACDGEDNDCNGATDAPGGEQDGDSDGVPACGDCDDADDTVSGLDEDADGFSPCTGDCNEASPAWFPGASDPWGDGMDQSCDGVDGLDYDGDGWPEDAAGVPDAIADCDDEDALLNHDDGDADGQDTCAGDCDDGEAAVFVGGIEDCTDGLDNDCDGTVDTPLVDPYEPNDISPTVGVPPILHPPASLGGTTLSPVSLEDPADVDWYWWQSSSGADGTVSVEVTLPTNGSYQVQSLYGLTGCPGGACTIGPTVTGSGTLSLSFPTGGNNVQNFIGVSAVTWHPDAGCIDGGYSVYYELLP